VKTLTTLLLGAAIGAVLLFLVKVAYL